jgi:glycosyltransferase involved in cell wall biosynthesis
MRVVVVLEAHFQITPDGKVWTRTNFAKPFWDRYLKAFEQVRVVARGNAVPEVETGWQVVNGPGVEFFAVPDYLGPFEYLKKRSAVRKRLRQAVDPGDALICRVGSRLADDLLPAIWKSGRPYALAVVGDPYEAFGPGAVRHPLRPLFRYFSTRNLKRQCERAAAVSYVTEYTLQKRYPCGNLGQAGMTDVELETEAYVREPRNAFCGSKRPRLVFVGSLAQMYKGPDVLLHAVRLLHASDFEVEAVLLGNGKHRNELQGLARTLGIEQQVSFLGELPGGAAVREHFDRADLLVMPSRTEGLPRAMIEAMCRALPCIGSDVGGIPELLEEEDLVPVGDAAALARKIKQVLTDPKLQRRMSERNLRNAQRFRPELLEARRTEFYSFLREQTEDWLKQQNRSGVSIIDASPASS